MENWQTWVEAASGLAALATAVLTLVQTAIARRRAARAGRDDPNG